MGVAPEKAFKLTTNFTVRDLLTSKDGLLSLWTKCIAGGFWFRFHFIESCVILKGSQFIM